MRLFFKNKFALISVLAIFLIQESFATNLIANAGFEDGDTGFSSGLISKNDFPATPDGPGSYYVGDNIADYRTDGVFAGTAANSGNNFFMADVSGDTTGAGSIIWQSDSTITITGTSDYRFEVYLASLVDNSGGRVAPSVAFEIGDGTNWVSLGVSEDFAAGFTNGDWQYKFSDLRLSRAGKYYIRMRNNQDQVNGNDIAMDDIYFGLASGSDNFLTDPPADPVTEFDVSTLDLGIVFESDVRDNDGLKNAVETASAFDKNATDDLVNKLVGLSDSQLVSAFAQISGDINASSISAARTSNRLLRDGVRNHMNEIENAKNSASSSENAFVKNLEIDRKDNLWLSTSAQKTENDGDSYSSGFTSYVNAIYGGYDIVKDQDSTAGLGFGYVNTRVGNDLSASGDVDSYQLFGYGDKNFGNVYLSGILGYGIDRYKTKRHINLFNYVAINDGRANGNTIFADLNAQYRFKNIRKGLVIAPDLRLRGESISRDRFTDSGSSETALESFRYSSKSAQAGVGLYVDNEFYSQSEKSLTFGLGYHLLHDFGDRIITVKNSLKDQNFNVNAAKFDPISHEFSVRSQYKTSESVAIYADAARVLNEDYSTIQGRLGVKIIW